MLNFYMGSRRLFSDDPTFVLHMPSVQNHLNLRRQTNLDAKRPEETSWKANTPRPPPTEADARLHGIHNKFLFNFRFI